MKDLDESWYIVKQPSQQCEILSEQELEILNNQLAAAADVDKWGPFKAKNQAIAKRIGLIRAGKCQPA